MDEELDAIDSFEENKNKRKRKFKNIDEKIADCLDPRKTKMRVEFNDRGSASVKSFAVKTRSEIKVTTSFMFWKIDHVCKALSQEFYLQNC